MRRHACVAGEVDSVVERGERVAIAVDADPAGEGQVPERRGERARAPPVDPAARRQAGAELVVIGFQRERGRGRNRHVAHQHGLALEAGKADIPALEDIEEYPAQAGDGGSCVIILHRDFLSLFLLQPKG